MNLHALFLNPKEIGNLKSIRGLEFSDNQLTGSIPISLGNLTNLAFLHLRENELSCSISKEIENLKSLRVIGSISNQLNGSIPDTLGNLTSLTNLYLGQNKLSGSIPSEIGNLRALVELSLGNNNLSGSVPISFGNFSSLGILNLLNNQLSGSIPQELGNLKLLNCRWVIINLLVICPKIYAKVDYSQFSANNNYFTGLIPKSLKTCTRLFRVRLEGNQLTGDISQAFGVYPDLSFIDLSQNKFYADVEWESTFRFYKAIPSEFGSLTDLEQHLSMNKFNDSVPSFLGDFLKLHYLNLSNNKFSQTIPFQLGKLDHVSELDLSHNSLEGQIPSEMSNMESLEKLNLSHNNLSDLIPTSFGGMLGLSYVDISYNDLEGLLPQNKAFHDAPRESLEGNKDFGTAKFLNPDSANWTALSGTHGYMAPGDLLTSLLSHSTSSSSSAFPLHQLSVWDILDHRISPPTHGVAGEVLFLVTLAFACSNANPQSRPTMMQVAQLLSTKRPQHLSDSQHIITWGDLLGLNGLNTENEILFYVFYTLSGSLTFTGS
ncbi:hypothetical protein ACLB2K_053600 [Fragaria x ananassa]